MQIKPGAYRYALFVGVAFLFLMALLLFLRPAKGQVGGAGSNAARGEQIVQSKCSRCHATGRSDASPNPKAPAFRDVGRNYPPEHLAEALAEGIVTGDNEMPEFKFGPRDIDAIIDYLEAMAANR